LKTRNKKIYLKNSSQSYEKVIITQFCFFSLRTNLFLSAPKEHIEKIRREKFSEDLHQYHVVKNLSVELYAKDVHLNT
jgi:hypothetical protein